MKKDEKTPGQSESQVPARSLKVKTELTIPLVSMAHTALLTCRVLGEPYIDEQITALGKDTNTKPTVVLICDLDDNAQKLLVCNAIILSAFRKAGMPITNRIFQLRAGNIREGKNYRDIHVVEMEYE